METFLLQNNRLWFLLDSLTPTFKLGVTIHSTNAALAKNLRSKLVAKADKCLLSINPNLKVGVSHTSYCCLKEKSLEIWNLTFEIHLITSIFLQKCPSCKKDTLTLR